MDTRYSGEPVSTVRPGMERDIQSRKEYSAIFRPTPRGSYQMLFPWEISIRVPDLKHVHVVVCVSDLSLLGEERIDYEIRHGQLLIPVLLRSAHIGFFTAVEERDEPPKVMVGIFENDGFSKLTDVFHFYNGEVFHALD